ncbi:hypothetical protein RUM43_005857 [Polyplax serrata]|uniref:Uncharacterized protein n=1 Tax=Polyplax serrata TaxID=468196 RepID=A0AAN8P0K1_POLSC
MNILHDDCDDGADDDDDDGGDCGGGVVLKLIKKKLVKMNVNNENIISVNSTNSNTFLCLSMYAVLED